MDKQILESSPYEKRTLRRALMNGIDLLHRVGIESAQLDVQVLICHALGLQRNDLYLQFDRPLTLAQEAHFENLLQRRLQREPVAYITGSKEFWSLDFAVDRTVLIPRPETELLVELAIEFVKPNARTASVKILDLGTGGGPIAVSLAKELADGRDLGCRCFARRALRGTAQCGAPRRSAADYFFRGRSFCAHCQ